MKNQAFPSLYHLNANRVPTPVPGRIFMFLDKDTGFISYKDSTGEVHPINVDSLSQYTKFQDALHKGYGVAQCYDWMLENYTGVGTLNASIYMGLAGGDSGCRRGTFGYAARRSLTDPTVSNYDCALFDPASSQILELDLTQRMANIAINAQPDGLGATVGYLLNHYEAPQDTTFFDDYAFDFSYSGKVFNSDEFTTAVNGSDLDLTFPNGHGMPLLAGNFSLWHTDPTNKEFGVEDDLYEVVDANTLKLLTRTAFAGSPAADGKHYLASSAVILHGAGNNDLSMFRARMRFSYDADKGPAGQW